MLRTSRCLILAEALLLIACSSPKEQLKPRAEIRKLGPSTIEILPRPGQLPYCLVFTTSERGVTRQLTMTDDDRSVTCEAGQPIGRVPYRIPAGEGSVRVHVLFSDRALRASSIAREISDLASVNPQFSAIDLRAPGQLLTETLEFSPSK